MSAGIATLDLGLTRAEVEATIAPYVGERLAATDPRWQRILEKSGRREQRRLAAGEAAGVRDEAEVGRAYSRHWSRPLEHLLTGKTVPFEWGAEGLLMQSIARRHLNHLLIARALRAVGARRVIDVGTGTGFHLFLLAAERPELELTGVELTAGGVDRAAEIRGAAVLPPEVARFATDPVAAPGGHRRVRIVRGTAAAIPLRDGAADTVCTVLALEQMDGIRREALAELRRVTSRWVVMVEPFLDLNADGARADYVAAFGYFAETIDGLRRHGLVPRAVYRDVPNKLALHVGLVVAERQ